MSLTDIENRTDFSFEPFILTDEDGMQVVVTLIKATFSIENGNTVVQSADQMGIIHTGEYWTDPGSSSIKYEPETAFVKTATDIILLGHACATRSDETELLVGLRVGSLQKTVKVFGDRYLTKHAGVVSVSKPLPFEKKALRYENAFGGWDLRDSALDRPRFEPRNPVGTGYRDSSVDSDDQFMLPNLEDPHRPYRGYGDSPPPAGFGFISPDWQPRASFAGTYDEAWNAQRKPLLPRDFDRRFFNAASPGLVAPGYLRGDEPVEVVNASPEGRLVFNLPGIAAPQCRIELRGGRTELLQTQLDTVIINTDENLVLLLWRSYTIVKNGPHDVLSIELWSDSNRSRTVTV